ncbi:MAG TPA: hypothetical protein VGE18_03110 [Candidatus Paceibacterota bacterium]
MKYLITTFALVIGLMAPTVTLAQTTQPAPAPTLFDVNANAPLSARKVYVETNLRDLLTQLSDIRFRVQTASNRLAQNGINVNASNTSLNLAHAALLTAQTNLDIFAQTPIDESPATVATLRARAKAAEDSLKTARASLIESIATLKLTLSSQ